MPRRATTLKPTSRAKLSKEQVARKYGYRSGLEKKIAKDLEALKVSFSFESKKLSYIQPETTRTYTPDFILNNGIIIETKGQFLRDDRKKHIWVRESNPELDIRFVFNNSRAKIYKGSPTTYGMWCEKNGFLYADKKIPSEWLEGA